MSRRCFPLLFQLVGCGLVEDLTRRSFAVEKDFSIDGAAIAERALRPQGDAVPAVSCGESAACKSDPALSPAFSCVQGSCRADLRMTRIAAVNLAADAPEVQGALDLIEPSVEDLRYQVTVHTLGLSVAGLRLCAAPASASDCDDAAAAPVAEIDPIPAGATPAGALAPVAGGRAALEHFLAGAGAPFQIIVQGVVELPGGAVVPQAEQMLRLRVTVQASAALDL